MSKEEEKEVIKLEAKLKGKDEDGETISISYAAEGKTVEEVLKKIGLPKGLNQLLKVRCVWGSEDVKVALAPHIVRQIFDQLDAGLFKRKFGIK
mgnify:FL=1